MDAEELDDTDLGIYEDDAECDSLCLDKEPVARHQPVNKKQKADIHNVPQVKFDRDEAAADHTSSPSKPGHKDVPRTNHYLYGLEQSEDKVSIQVEVTLKENTQKEDHHKSAGHNDEDQDGGVHDSCLVNSTSDTGSWSGIRANVNTPASVYREYFLNR